MGHTCTLLVRKILWAMNMMNMMKPVAVSRMGGVLHQDNLPPLLTKCDMGVPTCSR